MVTLSEIKNHNKRVGGHFFDRGNSPVVSKQGNYLVTKSFGGDKWVIYKYSKSDGRINLVDNQKKDADYSFQPYDTKAEAIKYAKILAGK